ncbi:MAG: hypothetical protein OEZ39_16930 [Gammaproteobacteria bacterium]|nr:hypothetical protein [Gammaproteobacteria bacterium]MDH5653546.1 hypothetical protein [Gammaproteobacteria bacterium]
MKKILPMMSLIPLLACSTVAMADDYAFDYKTYARPANMIQKVYSTDDPACGQIEERHFSSVVGAEGTQEAVRRIRYDALGTVCQNRVFNYLNTERKRVMVSKENWNLSGSRLNSIDTPESPVVRLTARMRKGQTFGSAAAVIRSTLDQQLPQGAIVETSAALGLEDVSVPYGSYTACLKVHTVRNSVAFSNFNRMAWYCQGVGEVKRIDTFSDGSAKIQLLTGAVVN